MEIASQTPIVHADFMADARAFFAERLIEAGLSVPTEEDPWHVILRYFSERRRRIDVARRAVVWSKELAARRLPDDVDQSLKLIEDASVKGRNLNAYLSKLIDKYGYEDMLLNDWNIHHLHLGPRDTPNFRRDELLFVFVTGTHIYFLDVRGHRDFENDDIFEILHCNWPHLIKHWRMDDMDGGDRITPEMRRRFRKPNKKGGKLIVPTTTKDGTVYMPIGGGYATAGNSSSATRQADMLARDIVRRQKFCMENARLLCEGLMANGVPLPPELRLRLKFSDKGMLVYEEISGATFSLVE